MLRRLPITVVLLGVLAAGALSLLETAEPAGAQSVAATTSPTFRIDVVKVSGLIDPINADLIRRAIASAERAHAVALVMQLNSTGGVLGRGALDRLTSSISHSTVPVAVWVGGSGRPRAYGAAFAITRSAAYAAVGPSARIGQSAGGAAGGAGGAAGAVDPAVAALAHQSISGTQAVERRVVAASAPTLGDFLVSLDGQSFGGHQLEIAQVVTIGGQPRREIRGDMQVAFEQLTVLPRLMHSAASPNVAFAMLVIALSLAMFEFFTAGIGVAAGTALLFGVLAAYGLGGLPTRPVSVALIGVGILGFAVDVQAGAPRAWTVIGALAMVAGSLRLYQGQSVSWWVLVVMGVLVGFFVITGMPAMVRTRFSTPTIGRDSMVGAMGVALSGVDPEGTVEVDGAPWRARTNRATPIAVGGAVRVVAIDGLLLEVEPEAGAARDYRH